MLLNTHAHRVKFIIASILMMLISPLLADSPDDNDIPTLAMRILGSNLFTEDINIELLCELSWLNFDAVNYAGTASNEEFGDLMSFCDNLGVFYTICPNEVMQYLKEYGDTTYRYWFRNSDSTFTSDYCFAQSNVDFDSITHHATAESLYHDDPDFSIEATVVLDLAESSNDHDFLWFYEVYDEAPAQQWRNAVENEDPWDNYIPNVYTQDTLGLDTLSLEEVEASGLFSIQKFYAENNEEKEVPFTLNFSLLHTIDQEDYTGLGDDIAYGSMADQARSVRAMMEAEYRYPPPDEDSFVDNSPDFIMLDYYPFRYVHPDSGTSAPEMCDDDWLFLIEHFEEGIDSTVIPAWEDSVPVFFFPQTFGVTGGPWMWDTTDAVPVIDYPSYRHRKPAPQEFRMLCNLALLHQAKGIFPYNLTSYLTPYGPGLTSNRIMSSLLDLHNIPFDAPYEEWVYTGRWPDDDFEYIRPDSIPPWISGYDPLFTLSSYPILLAGDPKNNEIHYEWLFEPYADLYNNVGDILGEVKTIGPEMHDLWWWEESGTEYWDVAEISVPDSSLLDNYVSPRIRVFYNEDRDHAYLFYVNRFCGEYYMGSTDEIPMYISIYGTDLPGSPGNPYLFEKALDHSRRFIIPITSGPRDLYCFNDTLEAGQSRLIEFMDTTSMAQADLRITSPDVFCYPSGYIGRNTDLRCRAGVSLYLGGTFYNMGTDSTGDVVVTFTDVTERPSTIIGRDTLNFSGLAQNFAPDSLSATILWNTDSTDIGGHIILISADSISGEEGYDNSVDVTVLVDPRDYAIDVLGDAWDMDDSTSSYAWNTDDIEAIAINWNSAEWTDSVSGMFEGMIEFDSGGYPFRGDISLAIPSDSTIDSEQYHMLSFGIVGYNPDYSTSSNSCVMYIKWTDTSDSTYAWTNLLTGTDYYVGNGWNEWSVIGPIDLNDVSGLNWGDDDVTELWLRFQSGNPDNYEDPDDISIRIGWIRLEESAP